LKLPLKYRQLFFGQCAILLYHRVTQIETDPQLLAVSPGNFEKHLLHIKSKYVLLSVDEMFSLLSARKNLPRRSVVITFDDGYSDNLFEALPLLERHRAQALFYICTGNLDTDQEFWWDELERLLLLPGRLPGKLALQAKGREMQFSTASDAERRQVYEELLPFLRIRTPDERKEIVRQIFEWAGKIPPRPSHRSMTAAEVKTLSESASAVLGAHTHSHQSLGALPGDIQEMEIRRSKEILEEITGTAITHFSYPFGTRRDFSGETIQLCRGKGFRWVAANYPGTADKSSDPFRLPRFLVRDWNEEEFALNLKKFFE
jgi:peptidoglycan/xylan/chitin deacetylase (PgdA/CDA1 family)